MITPAKRYLLVAAPVKDYDDYEVIAPGNDLNNAHVYARQNAAGQAGRRFFICEVVGFHESAIRPPSFTAFADAPMKALPRMAAPSEDLLS